jgi:leucyl aminopeptidase (aminopeptidase T)
LKIDSFKLNELDSAVKGTSNMMRGARKLVSTSLNLKKRESLLIGRKSLDQTSLARERGMWSPAPIVETAVGPEENGADLVELGFGLNPKSKMGRGLMSEDESQFGTVHFGLGEGRT